MTLVHEVLGHTFIAWIIGGKIYEIRVSLFGGGKVIADIGHTGDFIAFMFSLSGLTVNVFTGLIPLFFFKTVEKLNVSLALLIALFSLESLSGAITYLITGFYYEFGDPVNWSPYRNFLIQYGWIPFLMLLPFAVYAGIMLYLRIQQKIFPEFSVYRRILVTSVTLGTALAVYTGLFYLTEQHFAVTRAPNEAFLRERAKQIEIKKKSIADELKKSYPEMTDDEIKSRIDQLSVDVNPDEVPKQFPILYVVILLSIGGGFAAHARTKNNIEEKLSHIRKADVFWLGIFAGIMLIILEYCDETLYLT